MSNMWNSTKSNLKRETGSSVNKFQAFDEKHKKGNVKNTDAGKVSKSYNPDKDNSKKSAVRYGNVRLTVNVISRINAYQKLNGLNNRSEALTKILDRSLPKLLNKDQQNEAQVLEKLFKKGYKGRNY